MKQIYSLFFLLLSLSIISQEKYRKEFSLISHNDLYVSHSKDRYYTSGLFLTYRYLSKKREERIAKKIIELQLGHKMYTPFKIVVQSVSLHDRPFAAYLYGGFGINYVYKKNRILKTAIEVGVIGPAAFGKELQDFMHDMYGFDKAIGWHYQIRNALVINFEANYTKHLAINNSNHYDINTISKLRIGVGFTDISTGFYSRIGFKPLQSLFNSIAFNTNMNDKNSNFKRELESFLYLKSMVNYAFYDATIQGSFLNTGSPVTKTLQPLQLELELGFRFTINRFNFSYAINYQTDKQKDLYYKNRNMYGIISMNYLIR